MFSDFIGSENNSLYVYYKGLSKQLLTYKFETVKGVLVSVLYYKGLSKQLLTYKFETVKGVLVSVLH